MAANPTLLSMPIAENGTKNLIPETQATPGNGLMSQSTGFPAECSLPLGAGGVAPDRADFNGAFYLLGGVAFYAQKGFTFNYDATQDYYTGCVVIDTDDGNRYECIADMAAGTIAPSSDTTNTYWRLFGVDKFATTNLSNLTSTGEDHFLEQDFTIIYPNGGSEGSPANVTVNSRYVEANPFSGYYVMCVAEVFYDDTWSPTGYYNTPTTAGGTWAIQSGDNDSIVINTGYSYLSERRTYSGSDFTSGTPTTAPCRVKVWKIGKIPTP